MDSYCFDDIFRTVRLLRLVFYQEYCCTWNKLGEHVCLWNVFSRKRTAGAQEVNGQGGQLPTQFLALTKSIKYIVNVILNCPIYCLPTQILNASYSNKRSVQSKENLINVILRCPIYCLPTHILNASYCKRNAKSKENLINVILRWPIYCFSTHIFNASYSTKRRFGQQNDAPD